MSGGWRLLVGTAAVAFVVSGLGMAAPTSAQVDNGQSPILTEVTVNR